MQVTTIGLDLAKNIFQVHGITEDGTVAFNRSLRRAQMIAFFEKLEPCLVGMTSRIKQIKSAPERFDPWFADILQRKPTKLAAIAMANKTARIIWAVLTHNKPYEIRSA